jgi:hypothetical protein
MYAAIRTTRRAMSGTLSADDRSSVAQMLIDLTYGIPTSPWISMRGGGVMGAFVSAVNGLFDGIEYATMAAETPESNEEVRRDLFIKGLVSSYSLHDFALQALLATAGPGEYRRKSRTFRDALLDVKDE